MHLFSQITQLCRPLLLTGLMLLCASSALQAKVIEEVIKVPVKVKNMYGKELEQDIVVTLIYESSAAKPYPIAVINHGRAVKPEQRAAVGQAKYNKNSQWLASLGYMVAIPTRVGYGVSGGEDVEDSGLCSKKNYTPGYDAAADQTIATLSVLYQRPDVIKDKTIVLGQSYGGSTAISLAAKKPEGVLLAINFAGGGGGNPETHPQSPCGTYQLERMFATYGSTARMPTLWVYSENDQWMGTKYPKEWFDAFVAKGGQGDFALMPANGKDGHGIFSDAPQLWRETVLKFMQKHIPDFGARR